MTQRKKKKGFSRRKFLVRAAVGTGVLLGTGYLTRSIWRRSLLDTVANAPAMFMGNTDSPPLWFEVTGDSNIILYSPKVEMGQGTFTGMAQLAAEELEVDVKKIKVVHADTDSGNIDSFATGGSTSIEGFWQPLRELAATMREMLKNKAAEKMGLAAASLSVVNGVISGNGKSMTYGEVVEGVTEWEIPDTPTLKDPKDFKYIGKPVARVDLREKVVGAPIYGMDATMPDMLYGSIVRSPKIGATFVKADVSQAEQMPGVVKIVQEKDFVGVVAQSYQEAENAKNAIQAEWKTDKNWQLADIVEMTKVGKGDAHTIQKVGDAEDLFEKEETIISEYSSPIGAHAQIEPSGALAYVEDDKATVKLSTQVVSITRGEVAEALGLDVENVNIIPTFLGGGFGRRLHTPNAVQAALLSKAVGKPVKCFFNRKEEFQKDTFRPPTHHVMKGVLTSDGNIKAIEHNFSSGDVSYNSAIVPGFANTLLGADVGAVRGGAIQYGAIPNFNSVSWRVKLPFATSWWRSLGLLANTFAIESFMDELAIKAGKNPVQFRLDHIQNDEAGKRLKGVIEAAAKKANYTDEVQNGRAMGFAASTDAKTPVAQVAEVSIQNGEIIVHKVTCAIDCGIAVNPDQVRAQCEGCIVMGMSAAMHEKMNVVDSRLTPTIYGPYRMARMVHTPKEIDVVLVQGVDYAGAVGEPPLGPIGAAIANAVFRLTGQRLRTMPLELG